jgi:hypothetical protein
MVISAFHDRDVHEFVSSEPVAERHLCTIATPSQKRPILVEWMKLLDVRSPRRECS